MRQRNTLALAVRIASVVALILFCAWWPRAGLLIVGAAAWGALGALMLWAWAEYIARDRDEP